MPGRVLKENGSSEVKAQMWRWTLKLNRVEARVQ